MADLLTQNSKMKKSSETGPYILYNWGIPAIKTCPAAGACKTGCYAAQGSYVWPAVQAAYEYRLEVSKSPDFTAIMTAAVLKKEASARKKGKQMVIRIHDSGDFYSASYWLAWRDIMDACPETLFYAYTKQVRMLSTAALPTNLVLIFSQGGLFDAEIDVNRMRHSRVFPDLSSLIAAGYVDASADDTIAFTAKTTKIGLVYHGAKGYSKTEWKTVA